MDRLVEVAAEDGIALDCSGWAGTGTGWAAAEIRHEDREIVEEGEGFRVGIMVVTMCRGGGARGVGRGEGGGGVG